MRSEDATALAAALWAILLVAVLGRFRPWHVLPLLALALARPAGDGLRRGALWLALASPALVYGRFLALRSFDDASKVVVVIALFVPFLALWLAPILARRAPPAAEDR